MGTRNGWREEAEGAGLAGKLGPRAYLMLELVKPLLQTDLLYLQQGAILDFIQREAMLLSKISDQRVLWEGNSSEKPGFPPNDHPAPSLQPASETSIPALSSGTHHHSKAELPTPTPLAAGAHTREQPLLQGWASSSEDFFVILGISWWNPSPPLQQDCTAPHPVQVLTLTS